MSILDKWSWKYGRRFGVSNLMIYITATMLAVYLLELVLPIRLMSWLIFSRSLIFRGEIWRLLTFLVLPPSTSPMWLLISLYFYYFIGSSLENAWGAFKFTVYYLTGVLGAVISGMITGGTTNVYLNMSLFFAFANLFPDQQVLLFFVLPVKVKYIAYANWFFFLVSFLSGDGVTRVAIVFSLINFFLFFGGDVWISAKNTLRTIKRRREFNRQRKNYEDRWR